ncbi:TPA: bifunctional 3-(3-hydroxy-phenyl)propionate/3-hydroxycinnamic acid hydroxylase, partial [Acinetobacter baumannii]|nr:bifunctional 3-(3-hydroxy-phenyl)propionate/3-hydroxycinnamic acid hydroxylase [Acinetobacter baumannii]
APFPEKNTPVGKMFIQPHVQLENKDKILLDEVIGNNFAILAWGVNPTWGISPNVMKKWDKLGIKFIQVVPAVQLDAPNRSSHEHVITIGDVDTEIRSWFSQTNQSMVILRPDRFIAGLAIPQTVNSISEELFQKMHLVI